MRPQRSMQRRVRLWMAVLGTTILAGCWDGGTDPEEAKSIRHLSEMAGDLWEDLGLSAWGVNHLSLVGGGSVRGSGENSYIAGGGRLCIAVDAADNPVIAWEGWRSGISDIYLKRWNGRSWEELGGSATGGGVSDHPNTFTSPYVPCLALNASGYPILAWHERSPHGFFSYVYVKYWNGESWVEMGKGAASGSGLSGVGGGTPSLAVTSSGFPVIAWAKSVPNGSAIDVKRWNGAEWVELGAESAGGNGIHVADAGGMYVPISLALTPCGNPILAWAGWTSGKVFVKRWNGEVWEEFGSGSASGGGVSNSRGSSRDPVIAVRGGFTCVAWTDAGLSAKSDVYLRRARGPWCAD